MNIGDPLIEDIEVIRDYENPTLNLAKGHHHGIGYRGKDLIYFKSIDDVTVTSRKITLKEALEFLIAMEEADEKSENGFSEFTWTSKASNRFFRELRRAIS